MAEAARGNMRPCGCHRGRPCTCEMGGKPQATNYACGQCVNCLLNAKALRKNRNAVRKCVQYDEYMAEQHFERLEIAPGCVFRLRKPDWNVAAKSAFYTQMRQLRLGLLALRIQTEVNVERQKTLRKKYNRDLIKAQEALQRVEESRQANARSRRMATDVTHVDSDVFDSHSKQLIPAETLLPDVRARLEAANHAIAADERTLELVEAYVRGIAAAKLQQTVRAYQQAQRWRRVWWLFREDVQWAAAAVIQSVWRTVPCKRRLHFLRKMKREAHRRDAAERICQFFRELWAAKSRQAQKLHEEAMLKARAQKRKAVEHLLRVLAKAVARQALWKWHERQREATSHEERKTVAAAVLIQTRWRGLRDKLVYQRIRYRRLLSDPVRSLYDRFVCHGDLWRLLFEVDAAFRRYEYREREEQQDAVTFVSELVRDKRIHEDQVMQAWLTASALESPIIKGAKAMASAFSLHSEDATEPECFSLAQAVLQSPMAHDLVTLSPNQSKMDIFPDDLPPQVIRQATYEGFTVAETVAVMRGLLAQGKDASEPKLVLKELKRRAPLMTNPWKPERMARQELKSLMDADHSPVKQQRHALHNIVKQSKPAKRRPPPANAVNQVSFLSDNMIDNIPGALKGSINRLLLVAGLKCFDPDASQSIGRERGGTFVFRIEASTDLWRSYLEMASPLMKIRREQLVLASIQPHVQVLKENRCFSAFDILRNVRGIDEMVSWGIPRPLVMAIYDVIELLHRQTVNRGDPNIKRQMRVSAQFEAYVNRQRRREIPDGPALTIENSPSIGGEPDHTEAMREVAIAIERDVLELPLRSLETPSTAVLFKAFFLLCDNETERASSATNQLPRPLLSRGNYTRFLSDVVKAQIKGDGDRVKALVRIRMEIASGFAAETAAHLEKSRIACARQMKDLRRKKKLHSVLPEPLVAILDDILTTLPSETGPSVGHVGIIGPDVTLPHSHFVTKPPAPLAPLIRQSGVVVDTLDDSLRSIHIPF